MVVVALALPAVGLLGLPLSVVLLVRALSLGPLLVPALFLLGLCFAGLLVLLFCLLLGLTPVVNFAKLTSTTRTKRRTKLVMNVLRVVSCRAVDLATAPRGKLVKAVLLSLSLVHAHATSQVMGVYLMIASRKPLSLFVHLKIIQGT